MQAFAHMESSELQELDFKLGEIVDLKEAVLEWALNKNQINIQFHFYSFLLLHNTSIKQHPITFMYQEGPIMMNEGLDL